MGFESVAELVRAGVADGAGHLILPRVSTTSNQPRFLMVLCAR
jgi:hypothetical protein